MSDFQLLYRLACMSVGNFAFGLWGYISYFASIPLVLVWSWYALTHRLLRVTFFAVLAAIMLVVREYSV